MEFGEKVHRNRSNKGQKEHKIESKWSEGYFLGFYWRASEAIVGWDTSSCWSSSSLGR